MKLINELLMFILMISKKYNIDELFYTTTTTTTTTTATATTTLHLPSYLHGLIHEYHRSREDSSTLARFRLLRAAQKPVMDRRSSYGPGSV